MKNLREIDSALTQVKNFWNEKSCGEALYLPETKKISYELQRIWRYQLEPEILTFAKFEQYANKRVLEIGVGLGADHQLFAEAGADLYGIDLTPRAIEHVKKRFDLFGLHSHLSVANAQQLNFDADHFDFIYSWGVIHHAPNTEKIVEEIYRVLKPGAIAKIMIYHKYSLVGLMLWIRFALFRLRPWLSLKMIYARYLESPGTKAYSYQEAEKLFSQFKSIRICTTLSHADLLNSSVGQRHRGLLLTLAKTIWPRWFLKNIFQTVWFVYDD